MEGQREQPFTHVDIQGGLTGMRRCGIIHAIGDDPRTEWRE
jgi:hypothetical protein